MENVNCWDDEEFIERIKSQNENVRNMKLLKRYNTVKGTESGDRFKYTS